MERTKTYLNYTRFIVVFIFLVILAGAVVRTTQSGMGCPDWPTCFGKWIPPTSADELPTDFEKYLGKQDIDHSFNVYHTWIEYINRTLGALLGILILIHAVWSYRRFWKTDRRVVYYSFALLIIVAIQAWLGKEVVEANLAVVKVTAHMLLALVLAAIPLLIIARIKRTERVTDPTLRFVSVALLVLLLVQVMLGTQVREQIDEIAKSMNYEGRDVWIGKLDKFFIIHRSFSWILLLIGIYLWWRARSNFVLQKSANLIFASLLVTICIGVVMAYLHIPAVAQPIHLLMASTLVLMVFAFRLRLK